ncbi:MAG: leucyl aminopeptidase [Alteromonadaceae bacterium]|jgi:leucyl aminopeptidase
MKISNIKLPYRQLMLFFTITLASLSSYAEEEKLWITIGNDAVKQAEHSGAKIAPALADQPFMQNPVLIYQINSNKLAELSTLMHENHNRCGGYIVHDSYQEAVEALKGPKELLAFNAPPIQQQARVNALLPQILANNIRGNIATLSNFTNRFYNTRTGADAANWLTEQWRSLAVSKSWVTVEPYNHSGWGQNSVILKIQGRERPNEILVMGAHLDSTAGSSTREGTRAPGADDDASGIASLMQVAKVLLRDGKQPQRSIHIMGYAAEEVGLRGSKEIAAAYKSRGDNVVAALQLDMTNYNGSNDNIVFMTDYVNASFNSYLKSLLNSYQPQISYGDDRCGYACSDHASWYNQGYPTSMPFEAKFNGSNPSIHTRNDTLANSDPQAENSVPFARLALSFAIEMGNPIVDSGNQSPIAKFSTICDNYTCNYNSAASSDSDGQIVNYLWNFGDNQTSTLANPAHTYNNSGLFSVSLKVTDDQGASGQVEKNVDVPGDVIEPPILVIDYSCNLFTCEFDSSASSDNGQVSYLWNFGDGNSNTLSAPSHTYTQQGSYTVALTVTDNNGLTDTAAINITITDDSGNNCGDASLWQKTTSYALGDEVQFNGKKYQAIWWSTGASPEVYSQVWKFIEDCSDGGSDPEAPIAKFTYRVTAMQANFTDQSSDDKGISAYFWDFGDQQTSQTKNPSHTYGQAGSYSVSLKVTDADSLSDTYNKTIQIDDQGGECNASTWQASTIYNTGDRVAHNNFEYSARWWSQNNNPTDNSGPWAVWKNEGSCTS